MTPTTTTLPPLTDTGAAAGTDPVGPERMGEEATQERTTEVLALVEQALIGEPDVLDGWPNGIRVPVADLRLLLAAARRGWPGEPS